MSGVHPIASVVIPARNEAMDLPACLDAVLAQGWPREQLEVIVVDGVSVDGTADIARRRLEGQGLAGWGVLTNPAGSTPTSLNVGLAAARGEVICRVDARSLVQPDHVATCVDVLSSRPEVVVVGGAQVAVAREGGGLVERSVARALRNPYATGFARYRRGASSGPTDTVYLGAFRAADLRAVGGWDQRFATNQDYELNQRMARLGIVWFEAHLRTEYLPRSTLRDLLAQYRRFGRWKGAAWLEQGVAVRLRQACLLALPPIALVAVAGLLRRGHVAVLAVGAVGSLAVLDAAGREPGPAAERSLAAVASGVAAAGWWWGVVEQVGRFIAGQRLLR